jgi:hypothetical protein
LLAARPPLFLPFSLWIFRQLLIPRSQSHTLRPAQHLGL